MSAAWIVVDPAGQIAAPPETTAVGRGSTVTVTAAALVDTHPLALVHGQDVEVVVAAGEAVGAQLAGFESPAAGAHMQETPPEPESGVDVPAQISPSPRPKRRAARSR